jgi:hypothetical protein
MIEAKGGELASATCVSRQPYTSRHARHEAHRHSSRNHTKSVRTVLVNQFAQMIQNQKFLELLRLRCVISWLTDAGTPIDRFGKRSEFRVGLLPTCLPRQASAVRLAN